MFLLTCASFFFLICQKLSNLSTMIFLNRSFLMQGFWSKQVVGSLATSPIGLSVSECDGHCWNVVSFIRGAPQGSIPGPVLFTIYMNELGQGFTGFHFHFYADDKVICCFATTLAEANDPSLTKRFDCCSTYPASPETLS